MVNRANILHFLISARILPKKVFVDLNDLFHKDKMPLMQKPKYVTEKDGRRVYLWKRGLLENRLRLSQLGCTTVPSQQVLPSSLHIYVKNEMYLQTWKTDWDEVSQDAPSKKHSPSHSLSKPSILYSENMKLLKMFTKYRSPLCQ